MSYPPSYGSPQNGLGTAAMVLGIVALVLFFTIIVGVVCGVLAIVFGAIGRGRARRGQATNHGQATAGLVTGTIAVLASVFLFAVLIPSGGNDRFCFHIGTGSNPCAPN